MIEIALWFIGIVLCGIGYELQGIRDALNRINK